MLPRLSPYIESDSGITARLRPLLTGAAQLTTDRIRNALPDDLADEELTPIHRHELLTVPYRVGDSHIAKVVTTRSLRLHNLYVRTINLRARFYGLPAFLDGYLTPARAVSYRYDALQDTFSHGGFVPRPVTYDTNRLSAVLVTEYRQTTHSLGRAESTYETYLNALETIRQIHQTGRIHGSVFDHTFLSTQSHNALITDPIGKTTPADRHAAQAYDMSSLLVRFAPVAGSWSITPLTVSQLPDTVTQHMAGAVKLVAAADEDAQSWVANDIQQQLQTHHDTASS